MGDYKYLKDKDVAKRTLELLEDKITGCLPGKTGPGLHQGFHNEDVSTDDQALGKGDHPEVRV